jgi:mono/diheme cytochrome c family protein
VPATPENLAESRAHFADHCAACHANDGSGQTEIGEGLYPKPPDMRQSETQSLSDGELFYIIHHGIRLTGMPAWGKGAAGADEDSWKLVHFIRHLPNISQKELEEMKKLNPVSRNELQEEREIERFLSGEEPRSTPTKHHH